MNRSKRPMPAALRKQMSKAIRSPQSGITTPEVDLYGDQMRTQELNKKFPKSRVQKKTGLLIAMNIRLKAKRAKGTSKRTTPGAVSIETSPASPHREGKRWIKTLTKQILAKQTVQSHHGRKK